jgi:hypothetical protein
VPSGSLIGSEAFWALASSDALTGIRDQGRARYLKDMAPQVMITDRLASYGVAKRGIMPGVEYRQYRS